MTTVIGALQEELASLQTELSRDLRYQKMVKIKELLAMYEAPVVMDAPAVAAEPITASRRHVPATGANSNLNPRGKPNSLTTKILDAADSYLRKKGTRAATAEITNACVDAGVDLPGDLQRKRDYVSSILSHSPAINNIRGQGYGLIEWGDRPGANPGTAPETETPNSDQLSGAPKPNGVLPMSL